jgi:small-conductance mechanosensitive channel
VIFPASDSIEDVYQRLNLSMGVLLTAGLLTFLSFRHWALLLGFLAGGFIAVINFRILKRTIATVGEALAEGKTPASAGQQAFKFILRYALLAVALYVIFKSSEISVYGLFAGLFLPAGAVLIEAFYELYLAFRRGI